MRVLRPVLTTVFMAATLASTNLPVSAALDHVPVLDVEKSCRAAESYGLNDSKDTFRNCMLDEKEARTQLGQKWSKFKASSLRACVPSHPIPSYVEMLTCLEMYQDALLPYAGAGGTGSAPEGYTHDSPSPRPPPSPGPRPAGSF